MLTTLIGYLKGACHMSIGAIKTFFRDVIGVSISRGQLAKVIAKVAGQLVRPVVVPLARAYKPTFDNAHIAVAAGYVLQ